MRVQRKRNCCKVNDSSRRAVATERVLLSTSWMMYTGIRRSNEFKELKIKIVSCLTNITVSEIVIPLTYAAVPVILSGRWIIRDPYDISYDL